MDSKTINPEFKIFGEQSILNEMVINIETQANSERFPGGAAWKIESAVYKGMLFNIPKNDDDIFYYTIYYSYRDQAGMFRMDAVIPKESREGYDINAFYVYQKDEGVYLKYYSREIDIVNDNPLSISDVTLPVEGYFKKHSSVINDGYAQHFMKKFNLYIPEIQSYEAHSCNKINYD